MPVNFINKNAFARIPAVDPDNVSPGISMTEFQADADDK